MIMATPPEAGPKGWAAILLIVCTIVFGKWILLWLMLP